MSILRSKITLVVCIAVIGMFSTLVWRAYTKERALEQDIRTLEENIANAEEKNKELANLVEYFSDPAHLEKEARARFNLKKSEEEVLVIPADPSLPASTPVVTVRHTFSFVPIANFLRNLFRIEKSTE